MPISVLDRSWTYFALRGVIALMFGVVAMAAPLSTVVALAILWGFWALIDGAGSLVQSFKAPNSPARWSLVLAGVLSLVVAFLVIFQPGLSAVALTWVLGVWLIARGLIEALAAVVGVVEFRAAMLGSAAVDLVLGTLFVANPGIAVIGITWVLGLTALVWGIALCALAVWVRRAEGRTATSQVAGSAQ